MLDIDLSAIRHNYRTVSNSLDKQTQCSTVVKADAYGLGMEECSNAFYQEGCRLFFVASLDEALKLKSTMQDKTDIQIAVLHGLNGVTDTKSLNIFAQLGLIPVLNHLEEIKLWQSAATGQDIPYRAILHVDTGMARLGLSPQEFEDFLKQRDNFKDILWHSVMSHLACADDNDHIMTEQQYKRFLEITKHFPDIKTSLANSAGIFNDKKLHFGIVRPGAALYGLQLHKKQPKMKPVMFLNAPVLNIQNYKKGQTVGYGATYICEKPTTIATIPIGYANGYPRHASNKGIVYYNDIACPIIGRISMDLITIDITDITKQIHLGSQIEIIGKNQTADDLAKQAGTIGYEILTNLGKNHPKQYI